jgi:L-threonylcarbamoyladenylate synthase
MSDNSRIIAANPTGIAQTAAVLNAGGIVAVPTETVYGLAARAADGAAVARIYAAKGRPSFNPLIVHVGDAAAAARLVDIEPLAAALMAAFWPGPLTLVLPRRADADVAGLVTAGLDTLAVRCPAHPVMQALIAAAGPLAAPSANASGRISATTAAHVAASLGDRVGLILDGGPCAAGLESTIVAVGDGGWRLLRPGAVAVEAIAAVAGPPAVAAPTPGAVIAPGMLASHYAPAQPLRRNALTAGPDEFHIGFGAVTGDTSLSATGDLVEAAARLFDLLHVAQASGRAGIAVAPIPETGLGLAINDRLRRAAAPR